MRVCSKCKINKELSEYYRYKTGKIWTLCKACNRASVRMYRHTHPKVNSKSKELREKYKNSGQAREWNTKSYRKSKRKNEARAKAVWALESGKLIKQLCERLNENCNVGLTVHMHHDDYDKPFDVMWLCPHHHGEHHKELNAMKRELAETD